MDRQRIEFDGEGIKVYTNNGLIENNGKTTHTTIEGNFYMSAESVVRLLTHLSESTFIGNVGRFCVPDKWIMITSDEKVKTFVEGAIEDVTKSKEYKEKEWSKDDNCIHCNLFPTRYNGEEDFSESFYRWIKSEIIRLERILEEL